MTKLDVTELYVWLRAGEGPAPLLRVKSAIKTVQQTSSFVNQIKANISPTRSEEARQSSKDSSRGRAKDQARTVSAL